MTWPVAPGSAWSRAIPSGAEIAFPTGMRHRNVLSLIVVIVLGASACTVSTIAPPPDTEAPDAARPDTGQPPMQDCPHDPDDPDYVCDASVDAGLDSATPDSATPDSAIPDSAIPDSAIPDSCHPRQCHP